MTVCGVIPRIKELPPRAPAGYDHFSSCWHPGYRIWILRAHHKDDSYYEETVSAMDWVQKKSECLAEFRHRAVAALDARTVT
jgi:hypothetical protein